MIAIQMSSNSVVVRHHNSVDASFGINLMRSIDDTDDDDDDDDVNVGKPIQSIEPCQLEVKSS
jgi:hypothetical protein